MRTTEIVKYQSCDFVVAKETRMPVFRVVSDYDTVMGIATLNGWRDCQIFAYGEMLDRITWEKGWNLVPAELYHDTIPAEALRREQELIQAGITILDRVVAVDASMPGYEAPRTAFDRLLDKANSGLSFLLKGIVSLAGIAVAAIAISALAALVVAIVVAGAAIAAALAAAGAVGAIALYDPDYIICVSDGKDQIVWITIYQWREPSSD